MVALTKAAVQHPYDTEMVASRLTAVPVPRFTLRRSLEQRPAVAKFSWRLSVVECLELVNVEPFGHYRQMGLRCQEFSGDRVKNSSATVTRVPDRSPGVPSLADAQLPDEIR